MIFEGLVVEGVGNEDPRAMRLLSECREDGMEAKRFSEVTKMVKGRGGDLLHEGARPVWLLPVRKEERHGDF
jgi:hypothetical protein